MAAAHRPLADATIRGRRHADAHRLLEEGVTGLEAEVGVEADTADQDHHLGEDTIHLQEEVMSLYLEEDTVMTRLLAEDTTMTLRQEEDTMMILHQEEDMTTLHLLEETIHHHAEDTTTLLLEDLNAICRSHHREDESGNKIGCL